MKKTLVVGSLNMDYVLRTERLPLKGETIPSKEFHHVHGGKGMNQAVAINRLGGNPHLIGCLGEDNDGDSLLQALKSESIPINLIMRSKDVQTGIAFITVSEKGENTIVVHPGSNHALKEEWVIQAITDHSDASLLVLQMEIPHEVIISTICQAHKQGVPVLLNPSPYKDLPGNVLQKVHTLVVNEVEGLQAAKALDQDGSLSEDQISQPDTLVEFLVNQKIPQVILTMGDRGVYYNFGQSSEGRPAVLHQPAVSVKVVDSTAAGDSFLGAYVAGESLGYSIEQRISYGIHAGASAVTKTGAQPSIPAREDLLDAGWKD